MTIISNNSLRYNMTMDFWLLKRYKAEDLISKWKEIVDNAKSDPCEEAENFLADCLDVLYEKAAALSDQDRRLVLETAEEDIASRRLNEKTLQLAG